ncbi:MAG: hypothetical protein H7Y17_13120 [Chlorobia bacterium]|nr:hypothetical protein [Fimbriimonadaceae bacterium]
MTLNAYAAQKRLVLLEALKQGLPPSEGEFDAAILSEARVKGDPQMGSTRYEDHAIYCEFIYPDPKTTATILTVKLDSPERIVFLPVPEWVVENIWQGDITGTFHFESEARRLYEALGLELESGANQKWFGPQMAKRRE